MRIVLFGDSVTDMNRNRDAEIGDIWSFGCGYPFVLGSRLLTDYPGQFEIVNRGVSGNRVVDLYARIKRDVWNLCPDILSILVGMNDIGLEILSNDGVDIERFERVYRMMLNDTLSLFPDMKIIICEPFYLEGKVTNDSPERWEAFKEARKYAAIVERIASDYNLPFVKLQSKFDILAQKHGASYYLYDGVHPTIAGATVIADEWMKVFHSIFPKMTPAN